MKSFSKFSGLLAMLLAVTLPCSSMIDVGVLTPKEAKELGVVLKHRPNGDAGEMVWLEFKKEGFFEKLTYCEFQISDAKGNHLASARLDPHPVNHEQPKDVVSVSFSAVPAELERCSIMLVAYGSTKGDVGLILKVKDFLEAEKVKE
ncbi:hypothetical protein [Luteolibacter soli]|uniref:Uncharacterized protein n=1 Tax=Luteolibacter soli TaxID=3135280 RepID=A0ABU9AZC9_9BACT